MRKSLANQLAMNSRLDRAYCLTLLAEALLSQGELDEPLALIGQALETAESSGEHHYIPEMFRIRGEIHLARGDSAAAEREFQEAIELARRTDCRLLELRAAASWLRAGTTAAARYALSQALAWFTEGTGAPQITAARKLLALAAP
jgi:Flp pilus assembly protein TadD